VGDSTRIGNKLEAHELIGAKVLVVKNGVSFFENRARLLLPQASVIGTCDHSSSVSLYIELDSCKSHGCSEVCTNHGFIGRHHTEFDDRMKLSEDDPSSPNRPREREHHRSLKP
jgi:hypothetical protein